MIGKTAGIVLRTVKYGETSVIVSIFTRVYGLQSYIVNGVRTASKKTGNSKSVFFQPGSLLDLVAYHHEHTQLQRIKDYQWLYLYRHVFSDVHKHSVAVFMIELLSKCLKQPEEAEALFDFVEDCLRHLDMASPRQTANFPLFFGLQLPVFFGFGIQGKYSAETPWLDLQEGRFSEQIPVQIYPVSDVESHAISELIMVRQPDELEHIALQQEHRRKILNALEMYYAMHVPEFGQLRTLVVLRELMNG